MKNINGDDFTKEKSLWELYKLANRISMSKFHIFIISVSTILLIVNSVFIDKNPAHHLTELRSWASLGFNFTIATLGSLIAGFTIFATLSKPEMMIAMMGHINKKTNMPTLKYNFMAFMKVFISFIFFTFIYLMIMMFGQPNGLISSFVKLFPHADLIKRIIVIYAYVVTGCSLIYLLLTLKTFIFNIYAIVMNSIRWEYEISKKKDATEKTSPTTPPDQP
ncbi:hypothetical protein [Serratia marcescens]|uniref:hypothetical protein n=1 Tax=Serratia marcescens TaxID=615 RepID=UPI00217B0F4A|nr:hypothetical protein [Serratia marcescens]CAI0926102.1 Uncharacterised protein [Serratia marcescens]CAI1692408.1 Uncharacterised protein [Serratia marcescens]